MVPHDPLLELEFVRPSTSFYILSSFHLQGSSVQNIFVLQIDKIVHYPRFICFRVVVSNVESYTCK